VDGAAVSGARVTLQKNFGNACVPTLRTVSLGGHPWLLMVGSTGRGFSGKAASLDGPVCTSWGNTDVLTDAAGRYEIRIDLSGTPSTDCASGTVMSVEVNGYFAIEEPVILSCHSQPQTVDFELHPAVSPILLAPTTFDPVPQNLSLGNCSGYEVLFDWTDIEVPLATIENRYRVQLRRAGQLQGPLDTPVSESHYLFRYCGFVPDQELDGAFQWRVRGETQRRIGPWTDFRDLTFAPCRRSNNTRCEDPE
jgi:hypothetical protein